MRNPAKNKFSKPPLKLFVEDEFKESRLGQNLLKNFAAEHITSQGPADYPNLKKDELLLSRHQGAFIKPCPATPSYNCCSLSIFHFGQGCTINCRYCILEAYLGSSGLVLFGNIQEGINELAELLRQNPDERPKRFCTGEFTDSLLLDPQSLISQELVKIFAQSSDATLELKTKTDQVDHLLNLTHRGRTIISFSVNAPFICHHEEEKAASLISRLKAAQKAARAGFPLSLHFDPLIFHDNWEKGYAKTARLIGHYLQGTEIAWVSLGCFRYLPSLKNIMLEKYPKTKIYDGEFVKGGDGKMRYPRPLRAKIYRHLVGELKKVLPEKTVIYFCMESPRMWRDVFGFDPQTVGLTEMLDQRAIALSRKQV